MVAPYDEVAEDEESRKPTRKAPPVPVNKVRPTSRVLDSSGFDLDSTTKSHGSVSKNDIGFGSDRQEKQDKII